MRPKEAWRAVLKDARSRKRTKFGVRLDDEGVKERTVDGVRLASKREAKRFRELQLLEQAGEIKNLKRQVRYKLTLETVYVADFTYDWTHGGGSVVEDSKGYRTREYQRKAKAMKAQHGIEIREV